VQRFPWFLLAGLIVALALGWRGPDGSAGPREGARVLRVVDGDTVRVRLDGGGRETVRLIGIDTPETVKPGAPVERCGPEASRFAKRLLTGRRVRLEPGVEERDRYGRLLAYVFLDGRMVNEQLVARGLAEPLPIAPNTRHASRFEALAARAPRPRCATPR
jgi:micrococcal nuclease